MTLDLLQDNGETIPGVILAPDAPESVPQDGPAAVQPDQPASGNRPIDELLRCSDAMTMTRWSSTYSSRDTSVYLCYNLI